MGRPRPHRIGDVWERTWEGIDSHPDHPPIGTRLRVVGHERDCLLYLVMDSGEKCIPGVLDLQGWERPIEPQKEKND